jgi:hypothetical protein
MSEAVGSLAEEAAKLFGAAEEWWRAHAPSEHLGPECRVCPVCQVLSVVRGAQPELFEHLTEVVTSLLTSVRSTVDPTARARRAEAPVERIDIS